MKWTFLKQVQSRRSPANVKFSSNKRSRIRYRRDRLLDLLCTVKRRSDSAIGDLSTCCDRSTDLIDSYASLRSSNVWDNDIPPTSSEPTCSTLIDLLKAHSTALRKPIPFTDESPSGFPPVETDLGQPAFCPTCQHVVILLPKKRQKNLSETSNCYQQTVSDAYNVKRKRLDLPEEGNQPQRTYKHSRAATRGHFNPTYTPCCRKSNELDTSIYAEMCYDDLFDCSFQPGDAEVRQKRRAVRRLTQHHLPHNDSFETDPQSAMDTSFFGGFDLGLPDQPWMTSTLRSRTHNSNMSYDAETVYDDVATESESEPDYFSVATSGTADSDNFYIPPVNREVMDLGRLWSGNGRFISDVKRVRREYFLCEE